MNAGNRTEAYVTVEGLPHDVLIRGDAAQNRCGVAASFGEGASPPVLASTRHCQAACRFRAWRSVLKGADPSANPGTNPSPMHKCTRAQGV